jgi:hypothetical protein
MFTFEFHIQIRKKCSNSNLFRFKFVQTQICSDSNLFKLNFVQIWICSNSILLRFEFVQTRFCLNADFWTDLQLKQKVGKKKTQPYWAGPPGNACGRWPAERHTERPIGAPQFGTVEPYRVGPSPCHLPPSGFVIFMAADRSSLS